MPDAAPHNPIIVALDGMTMQHASQLADQLAGHVWGVKVNDLFFDPECTDLFWRDDLHVFLDLKLHDIPNTVTNQVTRLCQRFRPDLLTIHASGGPDMMAAAVAAAEKATEGKTRILAVTILTSISPERCEEIYGASPADRVQHLATTARDAGVYGVVCSAAELAYLPQGIKAVVPGIRPVWYQPDDDQARTGTPKAVLDAGAHYLVMGRPITKADDPLAAVQKTLAEISE